MCIGLVSQWFDQKVKIDGFDGEMKFKIYNYLEEIHLLVMEKELIYLCLLM